jgi:hypothetical protein
MNSGVCAGEIKWQTSGVTVWNVCSREFRNTDYFLYMVSLFSMFHNLIGYIWLKTQWRVVVNR